MKSIWNELLKFETKDLVQEYIKNKYNKDISSERISQITSNFIQGREYFESAGKADFTVRPLIQYYAIRALSRGLILCLDLSKKEENLEPSHGLTITNWSSCIKKANYQQLEIKITNGTFTELLSTTKNKNYLRANSTGINFSSFLSIPEKDYVFSLVDVFQYFPDLKKEFFSWTGKNLVFYKLNELKTTDDKINLKVEGKIDTENVELFLPKSLCGDKGIIQNRGETTIEYKNDGFYPNITQMWNSAFDVIGDACIVPTLPDEKGLNILSAMFMISFVLGMWARYYPTSWIGLRRGSKGDRIYPFIYRILDFIYEKYPIQVLDFLNEPDI